MTGADSKEVLVGQAGSLGFRRRACGMGISNAVVASFWRAILAESREPRARQNHPDDHRAADDPARRFRRHAQPRQPEPDGADDQDENREQADEACEQADEADQASRPAPQ